MFEIITIDGPASVGKSSLSKKVSKKYNSPILHSGRLYRAVALEIKNQKININDKKNIIKIAKSLKGENLKSKDLFSTEIDMISSKISARSLTSFASSFDVAFLAAGFFDAVAIFDYASEVRLGMASTAI